MRHLFAILMIAHAVAGARKEWEAKVPQLDEAWNSGMLSCYSRYT